MNFSNLSSCAMLCALLLCQISFDKFQNSSNILFKNLFEVHIHIYSKHIKGERLFCFCLLIFYIFVNRRAKVTHYGQAWLTYPEWTLQTIIVTITMLNFVNGHGQLGPCGDLGGGHFGGQNITKLTRFFHGVPQSSGGLFVAISNHFQHISCCPNFPAAPLSPSFKERENKGSS